MLNKILPLDPARYVRHAIHGDNRIWAETNCYVDVWIELLHAWGMEPIAALPFTLTIDFEGDQWTFFKFPLADIYELYGLDVQELAIMWRPLTTHIEEQVALGRVVLVELDSFHLPDTVGTAYRVAHTKSTVAVNAIDVAERYLGYFHNQGYHELRGDDFVKVFRLNETNPEFLPPYVEFVKQRKPALTGQDLVAMSLRLLRRQFELLPTRNPFEQFKARFQTDLQWLGNEPLAMFHLYSFSTLRQFGACYELVATYLHWLQDKTTKPLAEPIEAFTSLSTSAKTLQFHLARAMARKKAMDLAPFDVMASTWHKAIDQLKASYS